MIIANRSIHIIDYENNRILSRDIPATFDECFSIYRTKE